MVATWQTARFMGVRHSTRRLAFEHLELRTLAGLLFEPTDHEQLFLELLNAARANPAAYGASIGLDLSNVAASQPLAFHLDLIEAARLHSQDMNDREFFDHVNPSGLDPGDRITAADYDWMAYGESLAAGYNSPAEALRALIIDQGVPDLGHRKHLLAIDSISATLPEVGIGIVSGGSGPYRDYYTIDSARDFASGSPHDPILTGVVYQDLDLDGFYSVGEGFGGVTIRAVSSDGTVDASVDSFASGGYSLSLAAGQYTVTASGGSFPGLVQTDLVIGQFNMKVDFLPQGAVAADLSALLDDELGVWSGVWRLDRNSNDVWNGVRRGDLIGRFGIVRTDLPVPIDWDGDGRDDLAVFRSGRDLLVDSNKNRRWDGAGSDTLITLGDGGDQLLVGDWNQDGRKEIALWRNETGQFHLDANGDRALDSSDPQFQFIAFQPGDIAIAGDWDGDGRSEVGVFRGGNTFMLDSNGNRTWDGPGVDMEFTAAVSGGRPAVADYTGDGRSDIAVFLRNTFHIDTNSDGILDTTRVFAFGRQPVPGQWA